MAYVTTPPSLPLAPFVESLWDCDVPAQAHRYERMLPSAQATLIINLLEDETRTYSEAGGAWHCERLSGSTFGGARTRSFIIDTTEQQYVMGAIFHVGGAQAFTREPLDRLAERDIALEDLFGSAARRLRERLLNAGTAARRLALLDQWLYERLAHAEPQSPLLGALYALRQAPAGHIGRIVRSSGLSPRRFDALFHAQIGMGPKRYARLLRFRTVVEAVHRRERIDWSRVAADCGFYDQPHLVREFRAFSGMTPTEYTARNTVYVNHVPMD